MASILNNIRQECVDELSALAFFGDIPVLLEDRQNLADEIARALGVLKQTGGKNGAFVLMVPESASVRGSAEFGPVFSEIRFDALCVEFPAINRKSSSGTGHPVWEIAEQVAAALIQFKPASANGPVYLNDPSIVPVEFSIPGLQDSLPACRVSFAVPGSLAIVKTQAAAPVLTQLTSTVTMTSTTPGAAIFYSVNGTNPGPNSGTLYTAAIAKPAPGVTIRARAWLAGFFASEFSTLTIT